MAHMRNSGSLIVNARNLYGRKDKEHWKTIAVATRNGYEKGDAVKPLPKIDWAQAAIEERKAMKKGVA